MSIRSQRAGKSTRTEASSASARWQVWPPPEGTWVALAGLVPIFFAHYYYAALNTETALSLIMVETLVLGALLARKSYRRDLGRMRGLILPGALFTIVLAVGLLQLTPWAPGGPHPVWDYVGHGPGSTTIDRSSTTVELIKLMGLACIFVVGAMTGASDGRARAAVNVTLALGLLLSVWAFFGSVTGTVFQSQGRRLEGHFLNPNTAGTFMASLLILNIALLSRQLRTTKPAERVMAGVPLGATLFTFAICLLMTASRGAAAAFVVAVIAFVSLQLFSSKLKVTRAFPLGLAGLLLASCIIYIAGDAIIDRLASSDRDAVVRTAIWAEHWRAFLGSPLLGYGIGSTETVNKTLINTTNFSTLWNIKAILNVYLQWLQQAGLFGAMPMFACVGSIILTTLAGALHRSRMTLVLFGLLSLDVVFLVHGATDFALDAFSMAAMWSYFLGLQLALSQGSSK